MVGMLIVDQLPEHAANYCIICRFSSFSLDVASTESLLQAFLQKVSPNLLS